GIERLLTDVAALGGDGVRIDGVSLTPAHPEEALTLARQAAFADATAKASEYAELSGRTLGVVQWIDERPSGGGPRPMMARAMAAEAMPVATGDAQVGVDVTVHWNFAPAD
ncbi:MAG: SIMPL domain-containing protein, partial [Nakamurella sp.]